MAREGREIVYKLVSSVVLLGKHPSYTTNFLVQTNHEIFSGGTSVSTEITQCPSSDCSTILYQYVARDGANNLCV